MQSMDYLGINMVKSYFGLIFSRQDWSGVDYHRTRYTQNLTILKENLKSTAIKGELKKLIM